MLNNTYMSLIRQPSKHQYDMDYGVSIGYEGPNGAPGMDHVAVMQGMGALGRRVTEPDEIAAALRWAVQASAEYSVPALVEVLVERDADASMGLSIDAVNESWRWRTRGSSTPPSRSARQCRSETRARARRGPARTPPTTRPLAAHPRTGGRIRPAA